MCYLIRQQQTEAERGTTSPLNQDRLRPRWIGAVGATLIAGLAVAALVVPPSAPPLIIQKDSAGPVPVASTTVAEPTATVIEQVSARMDDGVPAAASDVAKTGADGCHHGL